MNSSTAVTLHRPLLSLLRSVRLSSTRPALYRHASLSAVSPSNATDTKSPATPTRLPSAAVPPVLTTVYQEAIAFLKQDSERLALEIKTVQSQLQDNPGDHKLEKLLAKLEIESQINDVDVRARHRAGLGDMSKAIYRHLKEKEWRETGQLGRTMETVHRLRVFPDILPAISPTVDLRVNFESAPISVGAFLSPARSFSPPTIHAQAFHPETQLYTLLMIDPDVPDPSKQSFTTYLHWLVPNIPISALDSGPLKLSLDDAPKCSLAYVPPHPSRGSSLHRYTILLLKQSTELDGLPSITRRGFSTREWLEATNTVAAGVLSWTSKWREQEAELITEIYKSHLKCPEPLYGRTPKPPSGRSRLPAHTPLPLTHRHPAVIQWETPVASVQPDA